MWLDHVMSVGDPDPSPLPTSPLALVAYLLGILIVVGLPLLVQSRRGPRPDSTPEPPPQLTTAATQQVADSAFDQIQRVMQAHIDAQAGQIRRLEGQLTSKESELEELRDENERLYKANAKLRAVRDE